jgi:phosphatidylserine/phosphatidylglycerophosphate/cardiolipin synthase-like enzyme
MVGMRTFTALLIALLMGAAVLPATALVAEPSATASPSASATPSPSPTQDPQAAVYPVFNYPTPGSPDPAITVELTRLIDQAQAGSTVSAALYVVMPSSSVVDALLNAHSRGVDVQVVMDSGQGQGTTIAEAMAQTIARLSAAIGTDTTAPSFVVNCVYACISKEPGSINHNKFVLLSQSGELADVVFQSTSNIRSDGSGDAAWNAATVSTGNPSLFDSYQTYFTNLAARITVPDNDYNAAQPPVQLAAWRPYYFPRTDGIDSVAQTLREVECSTPTAVDVMATFFTRSKVRNRLNAMAEQGCAVRVIARTRSITREFCESLRPPIDVRISDRSSATTVGIHAKYILISGTFEGSTRQAVWMGSENLTRSALRHNDETFLLIDDAALHASYRTNFDRIWNEPSVTPGCEKTGNVSEEQIEEESEQETTPLIKQAQSVKRALPARLRKKTVLKSIRTVQGQPLTTIATCRQKGTRQKYASRKTCVVKRPRSNPTLLLKPRAKTAVLKVRIMQTAPGSPTLEQYARSATYRYRR